MRELGEATRAFAKAKATRMRLISILLSLSRSLILRAGGGPLLLSIILGKIVLAALTISGVDR